MTFAPELPIDTDRLTLRWIDGENDVDAVHAYLSLPDVCRYIPFEPHTREKVAERLARPVMRQRSLDESGEGQALFFAIVLKDDGRMIGDVMLAWSDDTNAEIGYVLHPEFHGRGYATEAARAVLRLAFDGLGVHRVTARIDERNPASAGVLRKLGMRQEAVLVENEWFKGEWSTEIDFAILDREWRAGLASPA